MVKETPIGYKIYPVICVILLSFLVWIHWPWLGGSALATWPYMTRCSNELLSPKNSSGTYTKILFGVHAIRSKHPALDTDDDLHPNVTAEVITSPNHKETDFDRHILSLLADGEVVVHQTWKSTCVLKEKKKFIESWINVQERLHVVFWTDETMEAWVKHRFNGTRVMDGWKVIASSNDAHIKKADVFRALLIWFYGGMYTDLDIELKKPLTGFLRENLTTLVWEPEESMLRWTEFTEGSPRKTLILSGILLSGHRFSDFVGFYINWVVENHITGRSGKGDHVIDSTGPRIEAEAYYYYIHRLDGHDRLLRDITYPEFQNYAEHYSKTTWVESSIEDPACFEIASLFTSRGGFTLGIPD